MRVLGLIPARGGSKGIPGKNIKPLGNKPLIQYTLEAAKLSKRLSKSIVSTDDEAISDCVKLLGGDVPFLRPRSLALDDTPTFPVVQHALDFYFQRKEVFDAVCLLQVTSPFRIPSFIDEAIEKFDKSGCDALISVLPVPPKFNPHWLFEPDARGFLRIATGEEMIVSRRQDLQNAYYRDGSIYITRTEVLLKERSLYGRTVAYIENDPFLHVNIDTLDDWTQAEEKLPTYLARCAE